VSPDGRLAESVEGQIEIAFANVFAVLAAGGMAREDIVDMLVIVTRHETVPVFRAIRDRMLGGHLACSTMLVCGLANPDWEVEIAVTAARAD
jgi:enamine deaminase RidA (YjgF/YER057c/UK114 family)